MTEEFAFQQVLRNGGAVNRDEGLLVSLAVIMNGACDEFLATAALARDQDGSITHGHATHHFKDGLHRLGLADNIVVVLLNGERGFDRCSRAKLRGSLQGRVDHDLHGEGERLLAQEVKGPELHRLDHRLGRAEGTHDDHHGIRGFGPDLGKQVQPSSWPQVHLRDHQIGLLETEDLEGVCGIRLRDHADSRGLQLLARPVEEVRLAIDDQHCLIDRCTTHRL